MRWQGMCKAMTVVLVAACGHDGSSVDNTMGPPPPGSTPAPVASVTVQPTPATVLIGATLHLWATTKDSAGNVLSGRTVEWTSSDATVATVSGEGLVTAVAPGSATMTAVSEGKQATTTLTALRLVLTTVAAGVHYTCGVASDGAAFCWGFNDQGQLGNGPTTDTFVPSAVWGGLSFTTLSIQYAGGCGLKTDGSVFCWGSAGEPTSSGGALGGSRSGPALPVQIEGGRTFTAISDADGQACALTATGAAYCWGWNRYGQLGTGDTTDRPQPAPVTGGLTFRAISAGSDDHTCGLTTDGMGYCWGSNGVGQVGNGTTTSSTAPVAVSGALTFTSLSAGGGYTCGLATGGAAYCWGTSGTAPAALPGGLTFDSITTGTRSACGLTTAGAAYCWASNMVTPAAVPGGLTFAMISAATDHTCGLTTAGLAYCWGSNSHGQLGDGTQNSSNAPVKVFGQP